MILKVVMWLVSLLALAASALVAIVCLQFDPPMLIPLAGSALGVVFAVITNPLTSRMIGLWQRGGVIAALAVALTAGAAGICFFALRERDTWAQARSDAMTARMQANLTRSAIAQALNERRLPGEPEGAFTPDSPQVTALFEAADAVAKTYKADGGGGYPAAADCFEAMLAIGVDGDAFSSPTPEGNPEAYRRNREGLAFWFAVSQQARPFGDSIEVEQRLDQIRNYTSAWDANVLPGRCISDLPAGIKPPAA